MPELKQVTLYDFRRFKASKTYKLKKYNLLYVKELLGHKDIRSTLRYISLFDDESTHWTSIIAKTDEEVLQCMNDGMEKVLERDGKIYFRKAISYYINFKVRW